MSNNYKDILEETINEIFINIVDRKLKNGEELTEQEKEDYLQCLYERATKSIRNKDTGPKKSEMFVLKIISVTGKMLGGQAKEFGNAVKEASSGLKINKKNNLALLAGITITSNNMTSENFQTLNEQANEIKAYYNALMNYIGEYYKRYENYKPDFTNFGKEELEKMATSRAKIKELSKKYKK